MIYVFCLVPTCTSTFTTSTTRRWGWIRTSSSRLYAERGQWSGGRSHELHTPLNFAFVSSHHLALPYLFYVCKHCLLGFRLFQRSTNMVSVGKFRINMLLLNLVQHLFQLLPVCCWKFILLKQTVTFCSLLYLYSTRHWKANCQYFDNQREIVLENRSMQRVIPEQEENLISICSDISESSIWRMSF